MLWYPLLGLHPIIWGEYLSERAPDLKPSSLISLRLDSDFTYLLLLQQITTAKMAINTSQTMPRAIGTSTISTETSEVVVGNDWGMGRNISDLLPDISELDSSEHF